MEITNEKIKAYALENALKHEGTAKQSSIINALFAEGLEKSKIKDYIPKVKKILEEVNSLDKEKQKEEFENLKDQISKREVREVGVLPELENAQPKKVVMRFAPFPSGPLHIGNTRTLILNDEYAKKYEGKLLLVIDDTIGSEAKPVLKEAYDLIKEGVDWLGVKHEKPIYKSDRIEIYYKFAEELIKKGYMYVCDCKQEEFQELKKKQIDCPCRYLPPEKQIERWKEMFLPQTKEGSLVVRLKTSMQDPDPAFRDRAMFRISEREHPRVGKKYKVWPLLDFSWAIDNHLLGITHILRGVDLMMETRVEEFIRKIFNWPNPEVIYNGHFSIEGVKISKSKGAQEVLSKKYIGWNDPRTWSIQALRDRGFNKNAIREFCLNMGITKSNSVVPVESLYAVNKKYLENSPRFFFVENPVKIKISGSPPIETEIPAHPSSETAKNYPKRKFSTKQEFFISQQDFELMQDKNYRLLHLLNFKCSDLMTTKPKSYHFISENPQPDLDVKFIQWLPADEENKNKNIKTKIRMPDNSIVEGLAEPTIKNLKKGDVVQFERFGFCSLYKFDKKSNEAVFWFAHR